MSLNCVEINKIISELDLEGSFIQDIVQPGFDTIAFYTYKNGKAKTILICTAQNGNRINETSKRIPKNDKPLRFMEFLKSRIKGARINSFRQIGLERTVIMELSHSQTEIFNLYIRLWNNASNVILCDSDNIILDSMFRRPQKNEVTGKIFIPPVEDNSTLQDLDKWKIRDIPPEFNSFNEYIDFWYSENASSISRESLIEKAEKWYNIAKSKKELGLKNLIAKKESFQNASKFKHQGDLILAFGHEVAPNSRYLDCQDYETGKEIRILLNPNKTLQENAAEYYKNYKKAQSGFEELAHDIEIAEKQLSKLESQYNEILNEKNPVKIEQLLRKDSTPKQQIKKTHPGLDYTVNSWYILVGRDANENDELLRRHVRGDDLWLHTRDFPGGYVFIKNQRNKTVPLDILLDAANLAVYYSKARSSDKVDLYYTHVKYLRRAKNGPKGLVLPTHEKNLCIKIDKDRLQKLDKLHQESQI